MNTQSQLRQTELFGDTLGPDTVSLLASVIPISGLVYIPDFIDDVVQNALIKKIDEQIWLEDLKRRVQHYGYKYDYKSRRIDEDMRIGNLPEWAQSLSLQLVAKGWFSHAPDQLIINEYLPGQGIFSHVDCVPCFGDTIASLSLLSSCLMEFKHKETSETIPRLLEPKSLVVLRGAARFDWRHGIPARKTDMVDDRSVRRSRRVSLTFRTVKIS